MSKRYLNTINYGGTFNITAKGPLDSRTIVQTYEDLKKDDTWPNSESPAYVGMTVTVIDNASIYMLKDEDYTKDESWVIVTGSPTTGITGGTITGNSIYIEGYEDVDTGEVVLSGGTIQEVIGQLLTKIIILEEQLNNCITKIDDTDADVTVTYYDNVEGGIVAKITTDGVGKTNG